MSVTLFDIENPDHLSALRNVFFDVLDTYMKNQHQQVNTNDERWQTEDVCNYFGKDGKPIKPPTVYKYIREYGLPYTPGKPNLFWKSEVIAWGRMREQQKKKSRNRQQKATA